MKSLPVEESDILKIARLEAENLALRRELAGASARFTYLQQIYEKLANQWNAFQGCLPPSARIQPRDVQRAEGVGEMLNLIVQHLVGLGYGTNTLDDLISVLRRARPPTPTQASNASRQKELPGAEPYSIIDSY